MTNIAPIASLDLIPRTPEFADALNAAEFTLIPACMSRLGERDAEPLREPILMATSHLQAHITRLRQALVSGEPDSFETERALQGFTLMRAATEYWRDADSGNRWPNNPEAN